MNSIYNENEENDESLRKPIKRIKLEVDDNEAQKTESKVYSKIDLLNFFQKELSRKQESYVDHLLELFFLEQQGNLMEYYTWRKKLPSITLLQYFRTVAKDDELKYENLQLIKAGLDLTSVKIVPLSQLRLVAENPSNTTNLAQPTISSSAVSNVTSLSSVISHNNASSLTTPSTTSKSNVNNQSSKNVISLFTTPSLSSKTAHNNSSFQASKSLPPTPISNKKLRVNSIGISSVYESSIGSQEQIVERAKQEAHVMQRISELRKEGLWSAKRLPRIQEPPREKAHWDYLLEEMEWLATDFAQERKWKKAAAKKCARMVMKYHTDKESQFEKAEKENFLRLKKIASSISKEIKQFWSSVEKLVEFKIQTKLEEKRKKALDIHLSYIVDQTEKYSSWLVEGLNKNGSEAIDKKSSLNKQLVEKQTENVQIDNQERKKDDDEEFNLDSEDEEDDENTIAEQEKQENKQESAQELKDLEDEANLPIEKLLEKLGVDLENEDCDESLISEEETDVEETGDEEESVESEENSNEEVEKEEVGVEYLINFDSDKSIIEKKSGPTLEITDIAAGAESIQPKGNTLSAVQVQTKVPFLLKGSLREYQHIGLDWLVAMFDKKLNGILADEMGLGKTIQTISLLAHLACEKGIWGPHLIVVPTSVMLNWEMELKKWCPGFKIITYYGNPKERKLKRQGWTKPNQFHICITSYKLVVQDHNSFRRKKWKYLILDEAQHIKNFKSQRWQMLLNFNSSRRLLLTGTPLQNNLMELWSLMHFLMPNVFSSQRDFKDWFVNPVTGMIEGNQEFNEALIKRLHKVLRPFLLRRIKADVEKQLPKKYEHVLFCRLSKRQRFLYEEFMSLSKTKETLASGNFLSVINILMQLRKVCNHPNLFETRSVQSPFSIPKITLNTALLATAALDYNPLKNIDLNSWNGNLVDMCSKYSASDIYRIKTLQIPSKLIEDIDKFDQEVPQVPIVKFNNKNQLFSSCKLNVSNSLRIKNIQNKSDELKKTNSFNKKTNHNDKYLNKPNFLTVLNNSNHLSDHECMLRNFKPNVIEVRKETERKEKLKTLSAINALKCSRHALYTKDLLDVVDIQSNPRLYTTKNSKSFNIGQGYFTCLHNKNKSRRPYNYEYYSDTLTNILKTPEELIEKLNNQIDKFVFVVPPVKSSKPEIHISHEPSHKRRFKEYFENYLSYNLLKSTAVLHKLVSNMATQFPELRLIQYDCGKLQTLDKLLWNLKAGSHRVLIFTQMSRMLDIFEQFLNYHGHTYLRLDGSTKIEQRQALMERFNADKRIFCFILSTRSGGVGVNLTGADTVIFYDSDWNPTMDAQAQDRCHRIGQTRDVHIYRLISEKTVEENILKKARQKKFLGDVAIEGGNFTTAFFKNDSIKDLFNVSNEKHDKKTETRLLIEEIDDDKLSKMKSQLGQALHAAEEENDVKAAKTATAEASAEFAEFDESIPLDVDRVEEKSPEEEELEKLIDQLTPVEKYAMEFLESIQEPFQAEQLLQAEKEIEAQKKEWELGHLKSLKEEEEKVLKQLEQDEILTMSKEEVSQVYICNEINEVMPTWAPPTPPQDENDLYIDYSMSFLYDIKVMTESQLPPVYIQKESKRIRLENITNRSRQNKIRKDENINIPRSLFDKPTPFILKLRREVKIQKLKGILNGGPDISQLQKMLSNFGSNYTLPQPTTLQQQAALSKTPSLILHGTQQESQIHWSINEDWALVEIIQQIQELPINLLVMSPGHIPNWDFVSAYVNSKTSTYRSPKLCRHHYETVILPKEEGRGLNEPPKKLKKHQKALQAQVNHQSQILNTNINVNTPTKSQVRPVKTSNLFVQDNNYSFTQLMNSRFNNIIQIAKKRQPTIKPIFINTSGKNPKHLLLLQESDINYDQPLLPTVVAQHRAERIAKDKAKNQLFEQNLARQKLIQIQKQQQIIQCQQPVKTVVTSNVIANNSNTTQFQQPFQSKINPNINQNSLTVSKASVQQFVAAPSNINMSITANQQVSNLAKALSQAAATFQAQNSQQQAQIVPTPTVSVSNVVQQQPSRINTANISVNQTTLPKIIAQSPVSMSNTQTTSGGTVLSVASIPPPQKIIAATITNSNPKITSTQLAAYKQQYLIRQSKLQQIQIQPQLQTQSSVQAQLQSQSSQIIPSTQSTTSYFNNARVQISNNVLPQTAQQQVVQCTTQNLKANPSNTLITTSGGVPIVPITSQPKISDIAQIIQARNTRVQTTALQQPQQQQIIASLATKPVSTTVMSLTTLPVAVPIGSGQHQKIFTTTRSSQIYARKPTEEELDQFFPNRNQQKNQNSVTSTSVQQTNSASTTQQQQSGSISIPALTQVQFLHIQSPANQNVQSQQISKEGTSSSAGTAYLICPKGNSK